MGDERGAGRERRARWRPWLRALHRDLGYVAVGLTFVYALSGLAVNHLTDWKDGDASFASYAVTHELGVGALGAGGAGGAGTGEDAAIAEAVRAKLGIAEKPREVYRPAEGELEVLFEKRTLHVNVATGRVVEDGQRPRFLLRFANWLHLNRGKKAWTFIADFYAGGLLVLATSGIFMIAGKKGLLGRGAILVGLGVAVPVIYVAFAGP